MHKADNKDHKKAKDLLLATHKSIKERAGQESGNHEYKYLLGTMYHKGHGITQDLYQAIKWYKEAAIKGHQAANYFLNILIFQTATPLNHPLPPAFDSL